MKGDATYTAIRKSSSTLGETFTATLGFPPLLTHVLEIPNKLNGLPNWTLVELHLHLLLVPYLV